LAFMALAQLLPRCSLFHRGLKSILSMAESLPLPTLKEPENAPLVPHEAGELDAANHD
jgi:hypothetical protein